mmetsp:Transcript_30502/g.46753  ORF Transcript_30502/g.46753 Transcript_30502/m.46753 type:complete len:137 (+) Transcript_30502:481-891(+)
MRRMERVNTVIQVQSFQVGLLALFLVIVVEVCINFDGVNSSSVIQQEMPWHYHDRFYLLACFLLFIALFSFFASYYEVNVMFQVDTLLVLVGIVGTAIMLAITMAASGSLTEALHGAAADASSTSYETGKCVFMLP